LSKFMVKRPLPSGVKWTSSYYHLSAGGASLSTLAHKGHSIKPLDADEVTVAANIVKAAGNGISGSSPRFIAISLKESATSSRQAEIITLDPVIGQGYEYDVDLEQGAVVNTNMIPKGAQPLLTPEDCDLAERIVQQSAEVQKVLKERYGIDDISRVACDPWSVHLAGEEHKKLVNWRDDGVPGRLVQTFLYMRSHGDNLEDNHYAHPIDILPVVDLNAEQVVTIDGLDRPAPQIPTTSVQYHRDLLKTNSYLQTTWRNHTLKALNITQPDGPSFTVRDNQRVEWQKWSFDVGFNYREGVVLHNVHYDGRSVMKRASLVEMAVPYADPHASHPRKCAFDVGDYGLGYCANSLELGCDCLGHIHYFDAVLNDVDGNPVVKKKVMCMHEEDQGLLWKHVEYRNGHSESRRSRELVISFIATVVNYEYLFYWRLKMDGTIELEIKLSGELSTNLLSKEEEEAGGKPSHGVMVAPGVNAQIHQHMFCARLNMALDGIENTVSEVDAVREPLGPQNPYGNCFNVVETVLETEQEAVRTADATKARTWKISNATGRVNSLTGKPTAYKLVPFSKGPAQPTVLTDPTCEVSKKGFFANYNLFVTPFDEKERFPAGEYTPQGDGSIGLPDWIKANRDIVGKDLVLWHAFGVCHVPRVEDFPVMNCESVGFTLKPDCFFDGNPAIDISPDSNSASKLAAGCCKQ
jgi:primary-amine oxidase